MIPGKHNSQERLSPELMDKIHRRWGIVYQAVENEHLGERAVYPDVELMALPRAKQVVAKAPVENAAPVASAAIKLISRHEQQMQTERDRLIAEARAATERAVSPVEENIIEEDAAPNAAYIAALTTGSEPEVETEKDVKPEAKETPDALAA